MISARCWFRAPAAVLCATLAVSLGACGGGGADSAKKTTVPAGSTLELTAGQVQVEAAGTPGTLSDTDRDAIIDTLRKYVVAATIDPLHGKPVGNLAPIFTAEATASLTGPDGAAATDQGVPKATAQVKAKAPPVLLTALSDPSGAIDLVGATLYLDVNTKAAGGPVHLLRTGELVLRRDAGTWKIASYKLSVNRTGAGIPVPTTASTEKPQS